MRPKEEPIAADRIRLGLARIAVMTGKTVPTLRLAVVALIFQSIALVCLLLILLCPAPFSHNSISLLSVQVANFESSSAPSPSSTINATHSSSTSINQPTSAASLTNTTMAVGKLTKRQSNNASLPVSFERITNSSSSLGNTTTILNATSPSSALNPAHSFEFRLGPLGTCFRQTSKDDRRCSTAQLTGAYDYAVFQHVITPPVQLIDILPSKRNAYPTILLAIVIALLCLLSLNALHIVLLIKQAKQSFPRTAFPSWLTSLSETMKWAILACAVLLFCASGVEKYSLSQSCNTFNSATPTASLPDAQPFTLKAETSSGFGFAWCAAGVLCAAFYVQRLFVRRQRSEQKEEQSSTPSLPPTSSQMQASVERARSTMVGVFDDQQKDASGTDWNHLPSLYHAHEGNVRFVGGGGAEANGGPPMFGSEYGSRGKQSLPPFSMYHHHHHQGNKTFDEGQTPIYPPPPMRFRPMYEKRTEPWNAEPCGCAAPAPSPPSQTQPPLMMAAGFAATRTPSPAPSYWTSERTTSTSEKERERQLMAQLRKQRSQQTLSSSVNVAV